MKFKRKILFFIALLSLFYCVSLIQSTYAKYVTSADADADLTIAKWNILVNDQDVINNSNFSTAITPTFENNDNIKDGVIAPSANGYFDIEIDASNCDVSLNYSISAVASDDSTVTDLQITGYSINGGATEEYNNSITNDLAYDAVNKVITIRFYVTWYEGEDETMDNSSDTSSTVDGIAALNINASFTQLRS